MVKVCRNFHAVKNFFSQILSLRLAVILASLALDIVVEGGRSERDAQKDELQALR